MLMFFVNNRIETEGQRRAQSQQLTGRICDWIFGGAPKNSCVIAPVHCKTQSTVQLTDFRVYL